jgi:alanine dehydrogenase
LDRPTTLILTRSDVERLLRLEECIDAVERVFQLQAEGKVPSPEILGFHVPDGGFHIKAAGYSSYFAAKVNANFPGNPTHHGLPTIQGILALYDSEKGIPLALMDSIQLTAVRTAAATAVAAKYLARSDADVATICGCGVQGRVQLEAINLVRPLRRVYAVDTDRDQREQFARDLAAQLDIEAVPTADLNAAVVESRLIVTCTPSKRPLLGPGQVMKGTFIGAVGADNPEKQEIDPALMASSTVVVDHLEQCLTIGDLHHAVAAGMMQAGDVHAVLGEVIAGTRPGRRSDDEIIVFDSTGTALQDVAAAVLVYERAIRDGTGTRVALSGPGS